MTTSEKPMTRGTSVRTTATPNANVTDWSPESRRNCKWNACGTIKHHSDSHGLCYEVVHVDGSTAYYDPTELTVFQQQKAFLVGTHRDFFRTGEPAEIIAVVFYTPKGHDERLCYHIRFQDGTEDFTPVSNGAGYKIISEADVQAGDIPGPRK